MLWPIFQVRYIFRHGSSYHLIVTNHWHVPNMPTHIFFMFNPNDILPFVRSQDYNECWARYFNPTYKHRRESQEHEIF